MILLYTVFRNDACGCVQESTGQTIHTNRGVLYFCPSSRYCPLLRHSSFRRNAIARSTFFPLRERPSAFIACTQFPPVCVYTARCSFPILVYNVLIYTPSVRFYEQVLILRTCAVYPQTIYDRISHTIISHMYWHYNSIVNNTHNILYTCRCRAVALYNLNPTYFY